MIYIIGDSHVSVFSGTDINGNGLRQIQPEFGTCYTLSQGQLKPFIQVFEQRIPYFCPIKIGSNTAYNSFNKLPRIEQVIDEYKITKNDIIFLCFGEIDIRNHIGFKAERLNQSITDNIINCVNRYYETISYLKNKGNNIAVYGAPASSIGGNTSMDYKDVFFRNKMTIEFNEFLKNKCLENNIIFKDISKQMMLSNGSTDQKFIMDDIHLSQQAMPLIIEEFTNNGINVIELYK